MNNVKNDVRPISNTSKRLPIVFCLDISPSMSWDDGGFVAIDLLNESVKEFIHDLCKNQKAKAAAEVAFVAFSTKVEISTDFTPVRRFADVPPVFKTVDVGGTQMANAVFHSIRKLEEQIAKYKKNGLKYFEPFLVVITDGRDNDNEQLQANAIVAVNEKVSKDEMIPFIIGVGDEVDADILNQYAKGFDGGYFPVKGKDAAKNFGDAIKIVSYSAINAAKGDSASPGKTLLKDFYDEWINR